MNILRVGKTVIGLFATPYETYRSIIKGATLVDSLCIAGLVALYFSWASLLKHPAIAIFFITKQFVFLFCIVAFTHIILSWGIWKIGLALGGKGTYKEVLIAWSYTLIPTVLWFLFTSIMYLLVPPPRTTSIAGLSFSIIYLLISATLFWWKLMLGYLTLRFSLRLDLPRIGLMACIIGPLLFVYSIVMYWLGIFRVPFL